jgi:hypothetical protein
MTLTPEQTRKCSNCMWWAAKYRHLATAAECRGSPPHPAPGVNGYAWPTVGPDLWCGSFRMKEPGQ